MTSNLPFQLGLGLAKRASSFTSMEDAVLEGKMFHTVFEDVAGPQVSQEGDLSVDQRHGSDDASLVPLNDTPTESTGPTLTRSQIRQRVFSGTICGQSYDN